MNYTSVTEPQKREMLSAIGARSIDDLFEVIPRASRVEGLLDLPPAASELELQRETQMLAGMNNATDRLACFAGAGAYDHFVPVFIDQIISRGEYLTAYTPYQGEASQGSLQAFFEFQTQVSRLSGMDIANASLYEGASATAEAVLMAVNSTGKSGVLVAGSIHPHTLTVIKTVMSDLPVTVDVVPAGADGRINPADIRSRVNASTACLVVQSPNVWGLIEDWDELFTALKEIDANRVAIAVFNPIACALLKTPGACGADVAAGEGQPLGIPLQFGGPYLGLFAAKKSFMRRMPGRLVGQTTDSAGRRAFCLTLQTREQHIRGSKATSNVCTNQGLLALRATMYMSAMGPAGIREVAEQSWHKAHDAAKRIAAIPGYARLHSAEFFHEFAVRCPVPAAKVIAHAKSRGILAGVDLSSKQMHGIGGPNDLLIAVTEKRSKADIDALVAALAEAGK
jgi:glycine dehydrogenase subunit 1